MPATRWPTGIVDGLASAAYPAPPMLTYLEFEKPIAALDQRITELRDTASAGEIDIDAEVAKLEVKSARLLKETYAKLTPW